MKLNFESLLRPFEELSDHLQIVHLGCIKLEFTRLYFLTGWDHLHEVATAFLCVILAKALGHGLLCRHPKHFLKLGFFNFLEALADMLWYEDLLQVI